jgi:deoxyadenosine/deoxycytidine kinase
MTFNIISIEGNIGSGKSTLLKYLKEFIDSSSTSYQNIIFLKEPIEEWETIKDSNNKTMLEKFYADKEKYSFSFQMMAYISRLVYIKKAIESNPNAIIITERSLYTDKEVFAKMLFDDNKIEDVNYQIYLKWFDAFAKDYPISKIIYVKTDPEVCYNRIHKRNRNGEESIPIKYLEDCNNYHESMIKKYSIEQLILDGNIDIDTNTDTNTDIEDNKQVNEWINTILDFIK